MFNKDLDFDFFQDSSGEDNEAGEGDGYLSDDSGSEEIGAQSFKFNKAHCLHVFNTLKNGSASSNQFDQAARGFNNSGNAAYISLNGQNKAEYLRHLELIDLQLDLFHQKPS